MKNCKIFRRLWNKSLITRLQQCVHAAVHCLEHSEAIRRFECCLPEFKGQPGRKRLFSVHHSGLFYAAALIFCPRSVFCFGSGMSLVQRDEDEF